MNPRHTAVCPFHGALGEYALAGRIATYDDEDGIEEAEYQCELDPAHVWHQPSKLFWLRWIGWGGAWKERRDRFGDVG